MGNVEDHVLVGRSTTYSNANQQTLWHGNEGGGRHQHILHISDGHMQPTQGTWRDHIRPDIDQSHPQTNYREATKQ